MGDITRTKNQIHSKYDKQQRSECFIPYHACDPDNTDPQLCRGLAPSECDALMNRRGLEEPVPGMPVLTRAYNLPPVPMLHTVGPVAGGG